MDKTRLKEIILDQKEAFSQKQNSGMEMVTAGINISRVPGSRFAININHPHPNTNIGD